MPFNKKNVILDVKDISKSFGTNGNQELLVLEKVNFTMKEGEIIALLGRSGSGKSTLLRIIAGLTDATTGEVIYRKKQVLTPVYNVSMVFQSFALMPWLTVLQNVELGLEARNIEKAQRRTMALDAIDLIGLDGFENAYPRELSGGMKQRVGFARALVLKPDLLLMDEPFSALDVLTSETLRDDLLEIWERSNDMKGILYVTHNIEEAVLTADRIFIFASHPGNIASELSVALPLPRNSQDPKVLELIDQVYSLMISADTSEQQKHKNQHKRLTIGYRLPNIKIAEFTGLLGAAIELQNDKGAIDIPELADVLHINIAKLLQILELLSIFKLSLVDKSNLRITTLGVKFADAEIIDRKIIFANLLIANIPLAKHVISVLKERNYHCVHKSRFLTELEDHFTIDDAKTLFETFIEWARYAEIITYNAESGILTLDKTNSGE